MIDTIASREAGDDPIHKRLVEALEKPRQSYLWTPAHTVSFVPRVLPVIYGDGRALFHLMTLNQRPRYWIIRACSTWSCGADIDDGTRPYFGEIVDQIVTDLEEHFGRGRCGYSGGSLFWPRAERIRDCQCEECDDEYIAEWPEVDDDGGCSWRRVDWPLGFTTAPKSRDIDWHNLLAASP